MELPFAGFDDENEPDPAMALPDLGPQLSAAARGEAPLVEGPRYDRATLAREAGLPEARLQELESYGLVVPLEGEGIRAVYDEEALATARAAAGFFRHGVEARHIKMYQHFAEREAALFAQVLMPFLRQRNPAAHARFESDLADLARQSRALRGVLLYRAVRESLTE